MASLITAGDESKLKIAEEVATTCEGITDADRCEMASKVARCVHEESMKRKVVYGL